MTEKPFFIAPDVKSPDYASSLRRQFAWSGGQNQSFAMTLASQGLTTGQNPSMPAPPLPLTQENAGDMSVPMSRMSVLASLQARLAEQMEEAGLRPETESRQAAERALTDRNIRLDSREAAASGTGAGQAKPGQVGQKTEIGQSSVSSGSEREQEKAAVGIPLRGRGRTAGRILNPSGDQSGRSAGIALDARALSTLERLGVRGPAPRERTRRTGQTDELGSLSAQYESGSRGVSAIGYDRNGGTSYGKYQISSRQGTFRQFLDFLSDEAPELGRRLAKAGKANTGGTKGAVPDEWKAIAAEQPKRFEELQEKFIRESHYEPALAAIQEDLGRKKLSGPLQQVVWSTAVQHGPSGARRLFDMAVARLESKGRELDDRSLIDAIYSLRKGQFASSTRAVQAAVRQRFDDERRQALAMLEVTKLSA